MESLVGPPEKPSLSGLRLIESPHDLGECFFRKSFWGPRGRVLPSRTNESVENKTLVVENKGTLVVTNDESLLVGNTTDL